MAVVRVKPKTKGQEASWLGKGGWAGPVALFFQMLALAFVALQGADSWLTAPGVNTAAPPPEGQRASAGLSRADQVMKGPVICVLSAACWVLGAACWVLQPGSHLRSHSGRSPRTTLESIAPRAPAPSTQLLCPEVSRGDATALPPSPRWGPAKDNASVQLCALQVAWEQLQGTERSLFLGGFAKNFHS